MLNFLHQHAPGTKTDDLQASVYGLPTHQSLRATVDGPPARLREERGAAAHRAEADALFLWLGEALVDPIVEAKHFFAQVERLADVLVQRGEGR